MSNSLGGSQGYCLIEMGTLNQFVKRVAGLQEDFGDRVYRFRPLDDTRKQPFWLFEEENDEEILGGVLQIQGGRVYAISQDVYDFVSMTFARKLT